MKQSEIIVALFARGREIGYAALERGVLTRYGTKSIRGSRCGNAFREQVRVALLSLGVVQDVCTVTERPSTISKPGALCTEVYRRLKRRENVRVLSISEAKRRLCGSGKATHRDLAEVAAERYAILRPHLTDHPHRIKYWERMFIAVALAETVNSHR